MSAWMPSDEMDELVREFLIESHENLDRLDRELLILEKDPSAREAIAGIFRTIHTIKGTCGFLAFGKLEDLAHVGESLLSRMRDGELLATVDIMNALLAMVDAIREMLRAIETTGTEGDGDYAGIRDTLVRLQSDEAAAPDPARARPATAPPKSAPAAEAGERGHSVSDAYVRVDVGLLDTLMNLVGELVLARNQILQRVPEREDQSLSAACQRLNQITTELQSGVMKTRMQPIANIWDKFPRLVRDLSATLGKQVAIDMEGKDTELDKTIIEAIKDPLTHLVRNCVDHGIEEPEDREIAEKPATGTLRLRAYHEGGQVNIEIADDGAGIDTDRIRTKALERGFITPDQAARMSERDLQGLIFLPGFSTASAVSNISGRGVGMDVVRTNIERIGGIVDLASRPGAGTTFRIKIPLTLAIIPALVVTSGTERYAIPQVSLLELVRLEHEGTRSRIEVVHDTPVYRLRGALLPIVYLDQVLGVAASGAGSAAKDEADLNIVVLQAGRRRFGLVVDDINDTEEIVVKPLGRHLKGISSLSGATIMGDGRVALILDVLGIAQRARVVTEAHPHNQVAAAAPSEAAATDRQTLLVFHTGGGRRMAMPLSLVARLEEFPRASLERFGARAAVQYRGEILPLVDVGAALGDPPCAPHDVRGLPVVVFDTGKTRVGLAVDRIIDIVEEVITIRRDAEDATSGVVGCAVIQQQITELLDVAKLLASAAPELRQSPGGSS